MLNESGVQDVIIVRGYKKDAIDLPSVGTRDNDEFADTKELYSLACAREDLDGPCLVTYGDILFRPYMLDALLRAEGDIVIVADALWRDREQSAEGLVRDLIVADRAFTTNFLDDALVNLSAAGHGISPKDATGEWVGMLKLSKAGAAAVHVELDAMDADGLLRDAEIPDLLNRMMAAGHKVQVQYITGQWLDVDDVHDLAQARNIT
jgi:phosphoenolpyruvate phosphomutase